MLSYFFLTININGVNGFAEEDPCDEKKGKAFYSIFDIVFLDISDYVSHLDTQQNEKSSLSGKAARMVGCHRNLGHSLCTNR